MDNNKNKKQVQLVKIPKWIFLITLVMFFVITMVLLNLRLFRYGLVGKSIDAGDAWSTTALLSPELASSIARLI